MGEKDRQPVTIVSTPTRPRLAWSLYQQWLAAGASDVDVFQIDALSGPVFWASTSINLKPYTNGIEKEHFPALVQNDTLTANWSPCPGSSTPAYSITARICWRSMARNRRKTWRELTETAQRIQDAERAAGNDKNVGIRLAGPGLRGLDLQCPGPGVASHNGGRIVDARGKINIDNPQAAAAIVTAAGWIDTISPEGVLNYAEEEARGVFQSGQRRGSPRNHLIVAGGHRKASSRIASA
ncbi:MAG: hypothetical protein R3F44_12200 [Candidatus Competibacteraceae bacterium]